MPEPVRRCSSAAQDRPTLLVARCAHGQHDAHHTMPTTSDTLGCSPSTGPLMRAVLRLGSSAAVSAGSVSQVGLAPAPWLPADGHGLLLGPICPIYARSDLHHGDELTDKTRCKDSCDARPVPN